MCVFIDFSLSQIIVKTASFSTFFYLVIARTSVLEREVLFQNIGYPFK